jgi:site-specific DNA-methyltransferase (adenine-specific)
LFGGSVETEATLPIFTRFYRPPTGGFFINNYFFMDALQLRDNAKQQLSQIKTIETGIDYLNKVKAIETWAKAEKKDAELQNMIAEQKIRTQRILGQLLKESEVSKTSGNINQYTKNALVKETNQGKTKLSDFGITKDQSSTFQKIASLPDEVFEAEIATAKAESEKRIELTTSRVLTAAKEYEQEKKKADLREKISRQRVEIKISENIKNGDSLEILEGLNDGSIDIVLTDPPYGISYVSNRSIHENSITKRGLLNDGKEQAFELLDKTCEILSRKTAENAHLYFFCSWSVFSAFEAIISNYFTIKTPIVWDKGNKGSGDLENDWGNQTEIVIFCVKGKKLVNNRRGNIISVPRLHTSKMVHPTQKPIELLLDILAVSYVKGDFVVDPFMGSGSTIKACKEINAKCLGIELDSEMFNIANNFINE